MSHKTTPNRPKRAADKPLLTPREDKALRILREVARIEGGRPTTPYRPDRTNKYLLPQ